MTDKPEIRRRFQALVQDNQETVRIIRSAGDVQSLDISKSMAESVRTLNNYDEDMLTFISKCLSEGKEVAIQAAGPQKVMVHAALGLFLKRYY